MPQYIGFSTINACQPKSTNPISLNGVATSGSGTGTIGQPIYWGKKFRLLDEQLVAQDFINALNIPYGQKVGQPGYGTTLWDFIFEPNTADVQFQIETEIRRLAAQDPRIDINYVKAYPQDNGMLVEVQLSVVPFNNPAVLNVYFNQQTGTASLQ
jgi:phage baseplate assembly protein W